MRKEKHKEDLLDLWAQSRLIAGFGFALLTLSVIGIIYSIYSFQILNTNVEPTEFQNFIFGGSLIIGFLGIIMTIPFMATLGKRKR